MTIDIIAFAKSHGYDGAVHSGTWGKYDVYEPTFDGDEPAIVGLPFIILVDGETIRMSTEQEAFDYLDELVRIDTAKRYEARFGVTLYTPEISFTGYREEVTQADFFDVAQKCIERGKPMTDNERAEFFEPFIDGVDY